MPKKETKILGGSASRCGGRRVLVVKCGVGARKDTERMWDHQMGWWSSLPTSLVCKSQLIRKRNPSGNNQFITTVTGENTSLSHNSRGAIHIPGVVLQGASFTCIQSEWCLRGNCGAPATDYLDPLILASFHNTLRILGRRSFIIPKLRSLVHREVLR